ncbi:unnamed protein product, partial [Ceratitis capitata]
KINPYTGNYHLCQSRSAAISRNMELMGLSGDKYTKRFAAIQHPRGASTTTPSALSEPSQQFQKSPDTSKPCHESLNATQQFHKSADAKNNNNKENLITKQPTAAVAVETVTSMKHEEKKESEKSSRKRCKKSKGTSPKRRKRSLAYSKSEYMNELEQFLKA